MGEGEEGGGRVSGGGRESHSGQGRGVCGREHADHEEGGQGETAEE